MTSLKNDDTWSSTPDPQVKRWYAWLALAYLVLAIYGSFVPFHFRWLPWEVALERWRQVLFAGPQIQSRTDVAANVLLFIPLAFLWMGALCVNRSRRFSFSMGFILVPLGFFLSTSIEFAQLYFPRRTSSTSDIIAESLGGILGVLLWLIAGRRVTDWARKISRPWNTQKNLPALLLPGYLFFLLVSNVMPLDLTLSPAEIYHKVRDGKITLIPFRMHFANGFEAVEKSLWRIIFLFPVGFMLAFCPATAAQQKNNWRRVLALGLLLAGLLELMKVFVISRNSSTTNLITGGLAVLSGWAAVRIWQLKVRNDFLVHPFFLRGSVVLAGAFGLWVGFAILTTWQPFNFITDPAFLAGQWRRVYNIPFADYYAGSEYNAFDQFVRKIVLFIPLGVFLACPRFIRGMKHPGPLVLILGVALISFLEAGQLFLPSRHASYTDILVESFGMWLGFALARRWQESIPSIRRLLPASSGS